jgi:D-alanine-D-alanine ligase
MSLTLHKGMTKRVIRDAGIPTSDFLYSRRASEGDIKISATLFYQACSRGHWKGITPDSIIGRNEDTRPCLRKDADRLYQPVLIEQYLSGREFTVGITGTGPIPLWWEQWR